MTNNQEEEPTNSKVGEGEANSKGEKSREDEGTKGKEGGEAER